MLQISRVHSAINSEPSWWILNAFFYLRNSNGNSSPAKDGRRRGNTRTTYFHQIINGRHIQNTMSTTLINISESIQWDSYFGSNSLDWSLLPIPWASAPIYESFFTEWDQGGGPVIKRLWIPGIWWLFHDILPKALGGGWWWPYDLYERFHSSPMLTEPVKLLMALSYTKEIWQWQHYKYSSDHSHKLLIQDPHQVPSNWLRTVNWPQSFGPHRWLLLKGRLIFDSVAIVEEIMFHLEEGMILKMNFKKALHTISWNFLFDCLQHRGIPDT